MSDDTCPYFGDGHKPRCLCGHRAAPDGGGQLTRTSSPSRDDVEAPCVSDLLAIAYGGRTADDERADVVAWLREVATGWRKHGGDDGEYRALALEDELAAIERGDHVGAAARAKAAK